MRTEEIILREVRKVNARLDRLEHPRRKKKVKVDYSAHLDRKYGKKRLSA